MDREEIDTTVSSIFHSAYRLLDEFGTYNLLRERELVTLRTLSDSVSSGLKSMPKTLETSVMTSTSSELDADAEYENDVYRDDENSIYSINYICS